MSIALVYETQREVRRLLIAGSELAKDDFRLRKIVPLMKASGEKAPVFTRIAAALEAVLDAAAGKTAENLLELANLVNAVLYTQGDSGVQGELVEPAAPALNLNTRIPFRRLQPVIEALTSSGGGRIDLIRQAFRDPQFQDLRLIQPLITALDDGYAEVVEQAYNALKAYGAAVTPLLLDQLDLQGGKRAGRLGDLIAELLGPTGKSWYLQWIAQGSPEVKCAGIRALQVVPEGEAMLLELSEDKKKEFREAAYQALAALGSDQAVKRLFAVFHGKDWRSVVTALRNNQNPLLTPLLLEEAQRLLPEVLAVDVKATDQAGKKVSPKAPERFAAVLVCLENKRTPEVLQFYQTCLEHAEFLKQFRKGSDYDYLYSHIASSLAELLANNLLRYETSEAYQILDQLRHKPTNCLVAYSFEAALRYRTPEAIFDSYSPYLKQGRKDFACGELLRIMDYSVDFMPQFKLVDPDEYPEDAADSAAASRPTPQIAWDERWLKPLMALQETALVSRLVRRDSATTSISIKYLLKQLEDLSNIQRKPVKDIVCGLFQAGYEKLDEVILPILEHSFAHMNYSKRWFVEDFMKVLRFLPSTSASRLEDFAAVYLEDPSKQFQYELAMKLDAMARSLKQKQS